jgi:hypothetical protein
MSVTELLLLLITVILVTLVTVRFANEKNVSQPVEPIPMSMQMPMINLSTRGGDDRYTMAPRPQRDWIAEPEIPVRGALDPYPTRGAPEQYQQMGVIVGSDNKPLPLYGRRTAPRSDRFNYYTRTDSYNPVALPLLYKQKDCQDNLGCDELFSGETVRTGAIGDVMKVTLYGFDGPKYVA